MHGTILCVPASNWTNSSVLLLRAKDAKMSGLMVGVALFLISAPILACSAASAGVDEAAVARDLAAAVAPPCWQPVYAKTTGGLAGMMGMTRPVLCDPWEAPATLEAARTLARRYGEEAIPLWDRWAREARDFPKSGLALATLVALSDRPVGADALAGLLLGAESLPDQSVAFSLIADLHGPAARLLLERLVGDACERLRAKPDGLVRLHTGTLLARAGELLGAVGTEGTREVLRGLLNRGGDNDPSAHYLERAIQGLDARLAQPEAVRAAWSREAIEFAKAQWFHAGNISAQVGAHRAAGRLSDRGVRLGVPFLRFQLSRVSPDLAVAVAGNQRDAELIPDLIQVATRNAGGYTSSMAFAAVGQIGTREAFDALLALVRPGVDLRALSVLAKRGDVTTLLRLERLASDRSFSAADRADIAVARNYLTARLLGKTSAPSMGDGGPRFRAR
jgi:hypothetical protein